MQTKLWLKELGIPPSLIFLTLAPLDTNLLVPFFLFWVLLTFKMYIYVIVCVCPIYLFLFGHVTCGMLVPQTGIELALPVSLHRKHRALTTGLPVESQY